MLPVVLLVQVLHRWKDFLPGRRPPQDDELEADEDGDCCDRQAFEVGGQQDDDRDVGQDLDRAEGKKKDDLLDGGVDVVEPGQALRVEQLDRGEDQGRKAEWQAPVLACRLNGILDQILFFGSFIS